MNNYLKINYLELLDRVESVVFTFDFNGQIIYANKNFYDFFKIRTMQRGNIVIGESVFHFFRRDECVKLKKLLSLMEVNQSEVIQSDFIRSRRSGASLKILEILFEFRCENGYEYVIAIGKDITEVINFHLNLLTLRELEILKYVADGQITKSIAYSENVTESTISTIKQKLRKKLNLKNTSDLNNFAKRSLKLIKEKYVMIRMENKPIVEINKKWKLLADYSPDYLITLDCNAKIQFINHTMPGINREDIIGSSFYDYAQLDYRKEAKKCIDEVINSGEPCKFESIYIDIDGTPRTFESFVDPIIISDNVAGLTVRSKDITEKIILEKEFLKRMQILARAKQLAKIGTWEWEISSDLMKWSDEIYNILGLDKILYKPSIDSFSEFLIPHDRHLLLRENFEKPANRNSYNITCRIIDQKNKGIKHICILGEKHYDKNGNSMLIIGTMQDITDNRKKEDNLNVKIEKLEKELKECKGIN